VSPTHYCTGDVVYLITFETKAIPGIPIDVVAVNYAVFAIYIYISTSIELIIYFLNYMK
jgi:hypothetical protein